MKGFIFINQYGQYAKLTAVSGFSTVKQVDYTFELNQAEVFIGKLTAVRKYPILANDTAVPATSTRTVTIGE